LYLASSASSATWENNDLAVAGMATMKRKISKRDPEFFVSHVWAGFFDSGISYIAGKRIFNVLNTIIYIFGGALGEHLNSSIM